MDKITLLINCAALVLITVGFVVNLATHFRHTWITNSIKAIAIISACSATLKMLTNDDVIICFMGGSMLASLSCAASFNLQSLIKEWPAKKMLKEELPSRAIARLRQRGYSASASKALVLPICQDILLNPITRAHNEYLLEQLAGVHQVHQELKGLKTDCAFYSGSNYLRCTPNPQAETCEGCAHYKPNP